MDENIKKWKETTWQIHPSLHMTELDPPAVQFAVLDSDAIEAFKIFLKENRNQFRSECEAENNPTQRQFVKRAHITITWDRLFRTTPGDRVYLLTLSRDTSNESLTRMIVLSSSAPAGRKWLVTKVTYLDDTPIGWCIPLDLAIGRSIQVELKKENVFDLQKHYHELVEAG
jgi:hypothetical protein